MGDMKIIKRDCEKTPYLYVQQMVKMEKEDVDKSIQAPPGKIQKYR